MSITFCHFKNERKNNNKMEKETRKTDNSDDDGEEIPCVERRPSLSSLVETWVECGYKFEENQFVFEERYTPQEFACLYNTKVLSVERPVTAELAQLVLDVYARNGYLLRTFHPTTGDTQYVRNPCIAFSWVVNATYPDGLPHQDRALLSKNSAISAGTVCCACRRKVKASKKVMVSCIWCNRVWHRKCTRQKGPFNMCETCRVIPPNDRWIPRPGLAGLPKCSELSCANAVIQAIVATLPPVVKTVLMPNSARPQPLIHALQSLFSYMCEPRGYGAEERRTEACRMLNDYIRGEKAMMGLGAFKDTRGVLKEMMEQMYHAIDSVKDAFDGQVAKYYTCKYGHESVCVEPFKACLDIRNGHRSETSIRTLFKIAHLMEVEEERVCPVCKERTNFRINERVIKAPKVLALCFQKPFKIAKEDLTECNVLSDFLKSAINGSTPYVLTASIVNTHKKNF